MRNQITWKDAASIHNSIQDTRTCIGRAFSNGVSESEAEALDVIAEHMRAARDLMRAMLNAHPSAKGRVKV